MFGIYIHWPFCLSKCPYCDFNSHVRHQAIDETRFLNAFHAEIAHRASLTPGRIVRSIFFGGGTPSLMSAHAVGSILDKIATHWQIEPNAEITLEANPTSVEAQRFQGYRSAGVNRVSIGIQALNDPDLKALGRLHSVEEARDALSIAQKTFERSSFDLIYARSHQTSEAWRTELREALNMASGGHLSLYQLTIEPGTQFEALRARGRLTLPDEDLSRALWDITQEETERANMPAYEISNHARAGQEGQHNLVYWRSGEYAGIGPGAHGRINGDAGRLAQATEKHPETWMKMVEAQGHGLNEEELLSNEARGDEFLLMGLRLREGIDIDKYESISGRKLPEKIVKNLLEDGFLNITKGNKLTVTRLGFPLLNTIIEQLAR